MRRLTFAEMGLLLIATIFLSGALAMGIVALIEIGRTVAAVGPGGI